MKRYLAECFGTFFLAMAVNFTGDAMATGLVFMALVYILAPLSGAFFNPATTLTVYLHKRLSFMDMCMYMAAQVIGVCLFFCLAYVIFGAVIPARIIPADALKGAGTFELLLTMILCLIVLVVETSNRFKNSQHVGLILGLTLVGLVTFPGVYNPALAFGSMAANWVGGTGAMPGVTEGLVYLGLPLLAALLASFVYRSFYRDIQPHHEEPIHRAHW